MLDPQQLAADVAERIAQADRDALDATTAFAAGRFQDYWDKQAKVVMQRMEADGDAAINGINAGTDGQNGGSGGGSDTRPSSGS